MSEKVFRGSALIAIAAFGLANWNGAGGVGSVAAQDAPRDGTSKLEVDPAGVLPAGETSRWAAPAIGKQPQVAPSESATPPADAEPAAAVASAPAKPPLAVDRDGYASPRLAQGQHRLQAPFPDHNVVVCLAGCASGKEAIVFFEKRVATNETSYGRLASARVISVGLGGDGTSATNRVRPAPALPPVETSGGAITCVAGCYSTPKTYTGRRGLELQTPTKGRVLEGTWMTVTSGAEEPSHAVGPNVTVTKRGQQKVQRRNDSLGSEWFTRRF